MKIQAPLISLLILFLCTSALMMSRQHNDFPGSEPGKLKGEPFNPNALSQPQLQAAHAQWRFNLLKDENGNYNPAYSANAIQQANSYRSVSRSSGLGLQWQELGPANTGGRTRAILIDKRDTTNNTFYAGSVAGGLWKSTDGANTWHHLPGFDTWMAISCIAQGPAPDYSIYVGTGCGLDGTPNVGEVYAGVQYGNGIFKVNVNDSAIALTPTVMQGNIYNPIGYPPSPWFTVNRIAVNPSNANQIIAATLVGLYVSNNGGVTWTNGGLPETNTAMFTDVKWTADGNNVYATYISDTYYDGGMIYSNNGGVTWFPENSTNPGFPSAVGRVELGITPAASNVVYILMGDVPYGFTKGLYKSSDAGHTWSTVALGSAQYQLFELDGTGSGYDCQGNFDMAIAVSPVDTDMVYTGGVNFYTVSATSGVQQIGSLYQLRDYNAIVIADNNPNLMLIGGGEGIYKSTNAIAAFPNITFNSQNTGYNSVLNYGIGAGIDGSVIGGSQENGVNYISFSGNSPGVPVQVLPYEGFLNAVSQVNPDFYYSEHYYGWLLRSFDHASTFSTYFDTKVDPLGQNAPSACGGMGPTYDALFCTPYYMGETFNAFGGTKQVTYTPTDRTHYAGETVELTSATGNYHFNITLSDSVSLDSSIAVPDPIRSRIFMSTECGVYLTSEALNTTATPKWFRLTTPLNSVAQSFVSTPDGNNLFIGDQNGYFYHFSNLNIHADTCIYPLGTAIGTLYPTLADSDIRITQVAPGRSIAAMDVDPMDNNHVVIVVAGFSATNQPHVFETHDGGQTWVADTLGLPNMPCYSIVMHDAHTFIMGTEFGVWTWDGSSWHEDDDNLGRVAVYSMVERTLRTGGCPVLYIGTYGRGMWRCTTLTPAGCNTTIETAVNNVKPDAATELNIFPNPTHNSAKISLSLESSDNVIIRIFTLTGKLCSEKTYAHMPAGTNLIDLDATALSGGSYLCAATVGNAHTMSKLFIVAK